MTTTSINTKKRSNSESKKNTQNYPETGYLSDKWLEKAGIKRNSDVYNRLLGLELCGQNTLALQNNSFIEEYNVPDECVLFLFLFPADDKLNAAARSYENASTMLSIMNVHRAKDEEKYKYKVELIDGRDLKSIREKYFPSVFKSEEQLKILEENMKTLQEEHEKSTTSTEPADKRVKKENKIK